MADLRQRAPRQSDHGYLGAVAALPCLASLVTGPAIVRPVQVAHLRAASIEYGKRQTGKAERPDDRWTLPLSAAWHQGNTQRIGRRAGQHEMSEEAFWEGLHINPFTLCMALSDAYDARKPMLPVLMAAAAKARREKFG